MSAIPLTGEAALLWPKVQHASWFAFHTGVWWGSWIGVSSLAVQLEHALTPLVGTGPPGAYSAATLLAVVAIALIYLVGNRVGGRRGAVVAAAIVVITDPFRLDSSLGYSVPVLVIAGAGFVYALHCCLARTGRSEIVLLAAAGVLLGLANPLWIPGVVVAIVVVALRYAPPGHRLRIAGIGLLALVLIGLPNRVSVAEQHRGDPFADINGPIRYARNVEFLDRGHGAPTGTSPALDPYQSGTTVGLFHYLVADHSVPLAVGGSLSGGYEALKSLSQRSETRLAGLVGFLILIVGLCYTLIVPRLRMLIIVPFLATAPGLFVAYRTGADPFIAGAGMWPGLLAGASVLSFAAYQLSAPHLAAAWRGIGSLPPWRITGAHARACEAPPDPVLPVESAR